MRIKTKQELKFYLMADRMMNRGKFNYSFLGRVRVLLGFDPIMSYLEALRKVSYYRHAPGGANFIISVYYRYKFWRLGLKLGYTIDPDTFGYGLVIPHYGTIVVGSNTIGNYAALHVSTCVTGNGKKIGDGLYLSTGVTITSQVELGNGVSIGANSLVNKSFQNDNVLIAGMPANYIKEREVWYKEENGIHAERVLKVEALKSKMQLA